MKKFFGTDGVRGRAGEVLTPKLAYGIGRALTHNLHQSTGELPRILIGRDPRLSGSLLESAVTTGICAGGGHALSLGIIPTPAVSCLVREENAAAGIVISASHNPYDDNGIKIFDANGRKLPDTEEAEIERFLRGEYELDCATGAEIGTAEYRPDLAERYCQRLLRLFPLDLHGIKLVVDTACGATANLAAPLFRTLGAKVIPMANVCNGININEGCGSTHPQAMAAAVTKHNATCGLAFDGDGDRLIMADHNGRVIEGDQIMSILARNFHQHGQLANDTLVVTVMSNLGLHQAMEKMGVRVISTRVGDKHVMNAMADSGAVVGGEQSGHIILSQYNPTGDGMLTALAVLRVMVETGRSLAELADEMTLLPQIKENIRVLHPHEWETNERVQDAVLAASQRLQGRGRILIRASGTEPLLRLMAEGPEEAELHEISNELIPVLLEALGKAADRPSTKI